MAEEKHAERSGPIVVGRGESAASASNPHRAADDRLYHAYEANPVPWWVSLTWVAFFVFAVGYLIANLLE